MAHQRLRHLTPVLRHLLKFSPVVGLFGHRQVGKTTLISSLAGKYRTLDLKTDLMAIEADAMTWIEGVVGKARAGSTLAIDEAQMAPSLFPAVKEWVRRHPRPGQFLLSGSVRFSSRRLIRESLTGRIVNQELLPFDLAEAASLTGSDALRRILKRGAEVDLPSARFGVEDLEKYSEVGGLPGLCFIRSHTLFDAKLATQLETILERDLRLILETRHSFSTLLRFAEALAGLQGLSVDYQSIGRASGMSLQAVRRLLAAFEALFLVRLLPAEGGTRKPVLFFEDIGEGMFLGRSSRQPLDPHRRLVCLAFSLLRQQLAYSGDVQPRWFTFRTRGGATVPLCVATTLGAIGFIPCLNEAPTAKDLGSATSFLRAYSKSTVLFLTRGTRVHPISRRMLLSPLQGLL